MARKDTYTGDIERWCRQAIDQNKDAWSDFQDGEDGALNYLIGQVMEISGGRANPSDVKDSFQSLHTDTDPE